MTATQKSEAMIILYHLDSADPELNLISELAFVGAFSGDSNSLR